MKAIALAAALVAAGCAALPPGAQCRSLLGRPLGELPLERARREALEQDLARARLAAAAAPDDRDAAIWLARRLGYLGRFRAAVEVLSAALEVRPDDPFLLRHRGHRWLTLREFARAVQDLERAAHACRTTPDELEPDGQPVPGRPPHSTLHYNVRYHLGLAHFLRGDFAGAERAWLACLAVVGNDESRVAVVHWLWCARMRLGDPAGAAAVVASIDDTMDVVENVAYLQLCLCYQGRRQAAELAPRTGSAGSALAFGLAHLQLVRGDHHGARVAFARLAQEPNWAAFGVIAAEAELTR
ncbi:MAG: hypothetical protein KF830_03965 [Planctomycetes bacterium]|nr:hypothetical protein [Planctomycetota bacterium]